MNSTPSSQQADSLRHQAALRPGAPKVAIAGAKGGVGKTTLAVNLALLLARSGHRTLLVDLDPGCGDVDVHLRLPALFTLEDAVLAACTLEQALVDGPGGIKILTGRSGSTRLANGDQAFLLRALDLVDEAARAFDVVICDTGAGIGPAVLGTLDRADLILSVTTPDPASVTDAYALCKLLRQRGRPAPRLVVNRVRSRDEALRTAGKLTTVAQKFLGTEVPLAGWVQQDGLLELAVAEQRPFALHGQGPVLDDLRGLCAHVLSALPPVARRGALRAPSRPLALRPTTGAPA
ncbi:MAG: AAA family ATPase [Planctomycetes bacterium]|nr:AAA family ATPase [Planctomycetota bacterium]